MSKLYHGNQFYASHGRRHTMFGTPIAGAVISIYLASCANAPQLVVAGETVEPLLASLKAAAGDRQATDAVLAAVLTPPQPDFSITDHGTIMLLRPATEAATAWCDENLPEDAQMLGTAYAVEPRYIAVIAQGILADGLEIG